MPQSPMLVMTIAVAFGGAIGASLRFAAYRFFAAYLEHWLPAATLFVNVIGSFLLGLLVAATGQMPDWVRTGLTVGVLGSFTTFSTFSVETLSLAQEGEVGRALINIALNLVLCISGAWLGFRFGHS